MRDKVSTNGNRTLARLADCGGRSGVLRIERNGDGQSGSRRPLVAVS